MPIFAILLTEIVRGCTTKLATKATNKSSGIGGRLEPNLRHARTSQRTPKRSMSVPPASPLIFHPQLISDHWPLTLGTACLKEIQAMNECHARGFLARLKGDCNATREALNLCLRKEVRPAGFLLHIS